ncbi:helix-hairpin-helix domain-containing protein [candidate division TA06 bacterium]|uniref:Helix-hairpin-helix domain-containing protein n=1 Tax=candidate division TA06 bacterium TaxID=2250710 RepID=A0A523UMY5_UNCT6|nr:MAG: helix-hairpin-helix domain-containing protein [candidate division TA06 bacterium]
MERLLSRYSIVKNLSLVTRFGVLALSFLIWSPCGGQTELEETFEATSDVKESPELFERLEELRANPLDLNRATHEELIEIPWITPTMAKNIVEYRKKETLFKDVSELIHVKGFSALVIEKVLPYLSVRKVRTPITRRYQVRNRVADEHPKEDLHLGSSRRIYNRAIVDIAEKISISALAEKDPYEEKFLDFFSFCGQVKDLGPFASSVFGDYSLDFGEGLVFSPSRFIIKGSGITKGSERGLVPNRSTVEAGLLRGGATTFRFKNFVIHGFVSDAKLDASINEEGLVRSIYNDGLHRTENEVGKIDRLRETIFGGRARFSTSWFRLGMSGYSGRYEPAIAERTTNYYTFSGQSFGVVGADFEVGLGFTEFFGEFAKSVSLGEGYVVGLSYKEKRVNAGLLLRHYDEDFYSPHSAGFSDSDDDNEEGGYLEVGYKLGKRTKISGYMDLFRKLGPSYGSVYSSSGRDFRLQIEHKVHKRLKFKGRVYMKGRDKSAYGEEAFFKDRRGFRLQGEFKASKKATLIARFETVRAHLEEESTVDAGSLLYWEVVLKPVATVSLKGRVSVFDTDSWDARLYQYESDLPGVMRNVVVNGTGAMGYGLAGFRPVNWLKVTGKVSWKRKDGEEEWNVAGQTDIKFQMPKQ